MPTTTILFPTDFSTASDAALAHAEALARQSNARLLIVHVEEPPMAYGGGELYYGLPEPGPRALPTGTPPDSFHHGLYPSHPVRCPDGRFASRFLTTLRFRSRNALPCP